MLKSRVRDVRRGLRSEPLLCLELSTVGLVLTMQGSTVFSLLIAALIIQTLSCARICSAQISPSSAGGGPKGTLPQQVPSGVDNDPVRSPDDETSLQHSDDGKFTLRRDVEEVILNATVVDSH